MLQSMGSQRVRHSLVTEQQKSDLFTTPRQLSPQIPKSLCTQLKIKMFLKLTFCSLGPNHRITGLPTSTTFLQWHYFSTMPGSYRSWLLSENLPALPSHIYVSFLEFACFFDTIQFCGVLFIPYFRVTLPNQIVNHVWAASHPLFLLKLMVQARVI